MNRFKGKGLVHRTAAALAACWALLCLAACGAPEQQAVVTSDLLTPGTAAQDAVEQMETNEKQYAYVWDAQDVAGSTARIRASMERDRERLLAEDPQAAVRTDEEIEELLTHYQKMWEQKREKTYVISPQEAANIAGTVMEELYGMDLSQTELLIQCAQLGGFPQKAPQEEIWGVEKRYGHAGDNYAFVGVSTTTGRILLMSYGLSEEEKSAMEQTALPACMSLWEDGVLPRYLFDPADASYPALADKLEKQVKRLLSGSWITGGAQVTHVMLNLETQPPAQAGGDGSYLTAFCDDGRVLDVFLNYPFPNYGFSGYPLRAFRVEDRTDF